MNPSKVIQIIKDKEWLRLIKVAQAELQLKQTKLTEMI